MKKKIVRRSLNSRFHDPEANLSPLLARLFAARGLTDYSDCDGSLTKLIAPSQMRGCEDAAVLLADALAQNARILIIGDFDADGATSTALAVQALQSFGCQSVDFLVPNRFDFGYGLTPEIVEVAKGKHPDLLITVDNGISSIEGVEAAKAFGCKVLITDHHLPGDALPAADVIVNPNHPDCTFSSKSIAGVGVIFYVMMALRAELRERNWFLKQNIAEPNLGQLLDLVALGTVADVVALDRNNRILVEQGLRRIRSSACRPGISALIKQAGRNAERLVAMDLGFVVGPRLNAAGRLEDMSLGVQCLLETDGLQATSMAMELDGLNQARKAIEQDMKDSASVLLDQLQLQETGTPTGICLYNEEWHQGVIGILAARVKERLHRPVIAFAKVNDGEIKGSARSINGLHMRDCLDAIAKRHVGLLEKFGGHAMAAGMTLAEERYNDFAQAFDQQVTAMLTADQLQAQIVTDGELSPAEMTMEMAELLRQAAPWGQAFPEPTFDGVFALEQWRIVGQRHLKLLLRDRRNDQLFDAIQFNAEPDTLVQGSKDIRVVFRLDVNEYMGNRNLQLLVHYLEPV